MSHELILSPAFIRAAKKIRKRKPDADQSLARALGRLARDVTDRRLRSHKLKGDLSDRWSCKAGYDLRIIFKFVVINDVEFILLLTVGSHDDVY